MIPRNAVPTSHISPRPPIDINPRVPVTKVDPWLAISELFWPLAPLSAEEIARLWGLVRGAAEGSNITAAPIAEVVEC